MTDHAPLTDEELAAIEATLAKHVEPECERCTWDSGPHVIYCFVVEDVLVDVPRLIAEVRRLRGEVASANPIGGE